MNGTAEGRTTFANMVRRFIPNVRAALTRAGSTCPQPATVLSRIGQTAAKKTIAICALSPMPRISRKAG